MRAAALSPVAVSAAVLAAVLGAAPATAAAGRDACPADARYRGTAIDLDVRGADLHDVFRLIANVGRVNVVLADDVRGAVTLQLRRVPWDQVLCTVAAAKGLRVTVDGSVYLVRPAAPPR
jgi:type II secretory pathway component HofQ